MAGGGAREARNGKRTHAVFELTHAYGVCDGPNRRCDARRPRPTHTCRRAPPHCHTGAARPPPLRQAQRGLAAGQWTQCRAASPWTTPTQALDKARAPPPQTPSQGHPLGARAEWGPERPRAAPPTACRRLCLSRCAAAVPRRLQGGRLHTCLRRPRRADMAFDAFGRQIHSGTGPSMLSAQPAAHSAAGWCSGRPWWLGRLAPPPPPPPTPTRRGV